MDVIISVRYVSKERKIMMRASSVDAKERIAHKIHIFLLGECLIQIATGKSFYHSNETGEKFLFNKPNQETIDFMQAHDSCYSESQKAMIQKMMAKNIEKRPFIQEVALEFPLSLKGNIGSLSKHPWE